MRIQSHWLKWTFQTVLVLSSASVASTTPKHKPHAAPEVYSSVETEIIKRPAFSSTRVATPRPARTLQTVSAVHQQAGKAAPTPDAAPAFDVVPSDQIEAMGKRLKLVEALIRQHGRAYDYRTLTIKELERITAQLDASSKPKPASSAQPETAPEQLPIPSEADEIQKGETTSD